MRSTTRNRTDIPDRTADGLRILVAPSGYKESLDAEAVAAAIVTGLRRGCPDCEVHELPLADGGEGTAKTMARITQGRMIPTRVTGPVGVPIDAHFAILGERFTDLPTAVVELAAAAGLRHVPMDRRDPLRTTTRGVGELIARAIDVGARRIIVGCGDSGVNDGGAGLASALGVRFLDRDGRELGPGGVELLRLAHIDRSGRDARLDHVSIDVACNIKNVLTGPAGVARLFGPQKGATPDDVEHLAAALDNFAEVIERDCGICVREMPGGGASGGAGAGLHALFGAELHSRFDLLFPYFDVDEAIAKADLIITAEGGIDFKTVLGKVPAEIGARGRAAGKPVIVLAGTIGERAEEVLEHGVTAYFSTVPRPLTLAESIEETDEELELISDHLMRSFMAAFRLGRSRG